MHTAHSLGQKARGTVKKVGKVADTVAKVSAGVAAAAGTLAAGAAMVGAEPYRCWTLRESLVLRRQFRV